METNRGRKISTTDYIQKGQILVLHIQGTHREVAVLKKEEEEDTEVNQTEKERESVSNQTS